MPRRTTASQKVLALSAALGGTLAAAPAAEASPFSCSASAVRATVLGQAAEPVAAGAEGGCRRLLREAGALPAPLGAAAATARTDLQGDAADPASQQAVAVGSVSGFSLGALPRLPVELPTAQLPDGLDRLEVPLPASGALLGLPSSITVDALPAARALVPARALPDVPLLSVDTARSGATAACRDGAPSLTGASEVAGIRSLGQDLPADQAVDRVVGLLPAGLVDLSRIDPDAVVLPAGMSLDAPVVGPILRTALEAVLSKLGTVELPAAAGRVQVTPAEQDQADGTLTQRALRVRVDVLGRRVADATLGVAQVGAAGLDCAPPAAEVAPVQAESVAPASQLAVSCAKRRVTLVDVIEKPGRVALFGAADSRYVGQTVRIVLTATGRQVATAVVRPDGFFRTSAPLPHRSIRRTNLARYRAEIDGERSLALKLHRRMRISRMVTRADDVVIKGRIIGRMGDDQVVVTRRVSCAQDVVVKRVRPRADGTWEARVPAPEDAQAAVYRATTEVRKGESGKLFPTFTLPGYVSL